VSAFEEADGSLDDARRVFLTVHVRIALECFGLAMGNVHKGFFLSAALLLDKAGMR